MESLVRVYKDRTVTELMAEFTRRYERASPEKRCCLINALSDLNSPTGRAEDRLNCQKVAESQVSEIKAEEMSKLLPLWLITDPFPH